MKKISIFVSALILASMTLSAEEAAAASTATEEASTGAKFKDAFSSLGTSIKKGANDVGTNVKSKTQQAITKSCLGTWAFENGKATTTIVFGDDQAITISQTDGSSTTVWDGVYTKATTKVITFAPATKTVGESVEGLSDTEWAITYKASKKELKISSDSIPDDANGYDFSKTTIFTKVVPEAASE